MGQLTNQYVSQSYQGLIKLEDSTTGVTANLQNVQDGLGNNLPIKISSTEVTITGSFFGDGQGLTGITAVSSSFSNFAVSSSQAQNAVSASYAPQDPLPSGTISGSQQIVDLGFATTSSLNAFTSSYYVDSGSFDSRINQKLDTGSFNAYTSSNDTKVDSLIAQTGSYATTGSNTFIGNQTITGSLMSSGSIRTEDTLIAINGVQTNKITNPATAGDIVIQTSGFGGFKVILIDEVEVTGSLIVTDGITGSLQGTASYATNAGAAVSSSFAQNAISSSHSVNSDTSISSSYATNTDTAISSSFAQNAISSSHSVNSDTAISSSFATNSDTSVSSSFAQNAVSSSHSINSDTSISSSFAQNAISSSHSINSDTAISSSFATNADTAVSSSFAQNAVSSSHSVNSDTSISSSFAQNAISSSHSVNSDNAISSSFAQNAVSASYAPQDPLPSGLVSGSSQISYTGITDVPNGIVSGSGQVSFTGITDVPAGLISGSSQISDLGYATTGSNVFNGTQTISGSLNVTGEITALSASITYLETVYQTSSIIFSSGSNILGDEASDTQTLNGSVNIPLGNLNVTGATTSSLGFYGDLYGTSSYATNALSASQSQNAVSSSHSINSDNSVSSSFAQNAISSSFATNADTSVSSSFAQNAVSSSHSINSDTAISSSFATNSDTSVSSSFAQNAISSSHSVNSDTAISSSFATNSDTSVSSSFAQNAISSSHSVNSDTAISSSFATNSDTAISSSFAQNAISSSFATNADTSVSSSFAQNAISSSHSVNSDTAISSSFAQNAVSSSHSVNSDTSVSSSFAQNAVSSSHSVNSDTAISSSFATNADTSVSSSFAQNAVSSSHSINSDTSVSSSYSTNSDTSVSSSFAQNAVSSSHSVNSDTAISSSFATNSDTSVSSSFAQNAISSSYSVNSDTSVSSSFAQNAVSSSHSVNSDTSVSSSFAQNAVSSSYSDFAVTASFALNVPSIDTGSFATTGSNIFIGNQTVTGSVDVTGSFINNGLTYPLVDNGEGAFVQTDGAGNLSLQYVQSILEPIRNGELTTLLKGTPVYVSGALGANPIVYRADANDPNKMPVTYIVSDDLLSNNVGTGLILGKIDGVNTTGFPAGTEIFVGIGGGYTDVRPTGSAIVQSLGIVTKEGTGGQGIILNPGPANLPNIQEGYLWVGDSDSYPTPVLTSSLDVATSVSSSFAQNAISSSYAVTASFTPFAVAAVTASFALNANIDSGSFATTGSNVFRGTQNISGSVDISGSLFMRTDGVGPGLISRNFSYLTSSLNAAGNIFFQDLTTTSTVSQSLIVSSSNNIVFNRPSVNNNTFDSVIYGSGSSPVGGSNIYSIPPQISATNRGQNVPLVMQHNIGRSGVVPFQLTFPTGSITGSASVSNNYIGGALAYNGPHSSRMPTINGNNIIGTLTYSAIILQTSFSSSIAPSISNNYINAGSVSLQARSGSFLFNNNNINGNAAVINNFNVTSASHYVNFVNNSITNNPGIQFMGSSNVNSPRTFSGNIIGGGSISILNRNELTPSGSLNNSLVIGQGLTVTASHRDTGAEGSSVFLGRFNATGSNVSDSAQTVFAVGTGTATTNRRTSLHLSSSGLFDVRDGLNISGSVGLFNNSTTGTLNLTGSVNVSGSLSVKEGGINVSGGQIQTNDEIVFNGGKFFPESMENFVKLNATSTTTLAIDNFNLTTPASQSLWSSTVNTGSNYSEQSLQVTNGGTTGTLALRNTGGITTCTITGSLNVSNGVTGSFYGDGSGLTGLTITEATFTVELMDALITDFYAPGDLEINTVTAIVGTPTVTTIEVNNSSYTLGDTISQGDKITVEVDTNAVLNLSIQYV